MDRETLMIKPDITSMIKGERSGCLYYVARGLHVYDLKSGRTIQNLPDTYYSTLAVSNDGSLLVCAHPVRTSVEMIFYHIGESLSEQKRVTLRTPVSVFDPVVSDDDRSVFYCGDDNTVWKVPVSSGDPKCVFRCRDNEVITSMDVSDQGILISVFGIGGNISNSFVVLSDL